MLPFKTQRHLRWLASVIFLQQISLQFFTLQEGEFGKCRERNKGVIVHGLNERHIAHYICIEFQNHSNDVTIMASNYWIFVKGIHLWPMDSLHQGAVRRKAFPYHDIIMSKDSNHMLLSNQKTIPIADERTSPQNITDNGKNKKIAQRHFRNGR